MKISGLIGFVYVRKSAGAFEIWVGATQLLLCWVAFRRGRVWYLSGLVRTNNDSWKTGFGNNLLETLSIRNILGQGQL